MLVLSRPPGLGNLRRPARRGGRAPARRCGTAHLPPSRHRPFPAPVL